MRLGDLVSSARGAIRIGPFGSQLHAHEYTDDPAGIPVVMPKDMVDGRVDRRSVKRVDEMTARRLDTHRLAPGDIVLARRGDVGRHAFIGADEANWLCGTGSVRIHVADHGVVLPAFLRAAIGNPSVADWLAKHAVGATMPNLNGAIVADIPLRIPNLETQRRVVTVLDALAELIAAHSREIEVLDDTARSLYREWFERLRFPGHERNGFVASEVGRIPAGWQVQALAEASEYLVDGDWIETKDQGGQDYRLLQVSNIGLGAFRETGNFRYINVETFARLRCTEVRVGDILIARMPDPIGRAWLVDYLREPAITAVDVAILRPLSPSSGLFLSLWLNSAATLAHAEAVATGTTRKRISRSVLSALKVVLPPAEILELFAQHAGRFFEARTLATRAVVALAATRDLLLPRLVTGGIDISDVDIDDLLALESE